MTDKLDDIPVNSATGKEYAEAKQFCRAFEHAKTLHMEIEFVFSAVRALRKGDPLPDAITHAQWEWDL